MTTPYPGIFKSLPERAVHIQLLLMLGGGAASICPDLAEIKALIEN
jgi:hypothetical protein